MKLIKKQSIWISDLTHTAQGSSSWTFPLGASYVFSYAKQELGSEFDIKLFKFPSSLDKALCAHSPKMICFSNYSWNFELSYKFALLAKQRDPSVITVFGGPNFPSDQNEKVEFFKKRPAIDFNIELEGELGFVDLVKSLIGYNFNAATLKKQGKKIINTCYIYEDQLITGPLQRIKDINTIPSPYLTGALDEFFNFPLVPLIETTRGCPFTCTFCVDGHDSSNKISRYDPERVKEELYLIAKKVKNVDKIEITDLNFGMYKEDLITAKAIADIQRIYNYPTLIGASVGKNMPKRITEVTNMLNGLDMFASLQSSDSIVLKAIKRSNISSKAYKEMIHSGNSLRTTKTTSAIILAMPEDTKKKHFESIRFCIDNNVNTVRAYQAMLLVGTEMASKATRKKYDLKTKFRTIPGSLGNYDIMGKKYSVAELEEIIVGTNTLSEKDYLECRVMNLFVTTFYNNSLFYEIYAMLRSIGASCFDCLIYMIEHTELYSDKIKKILAKFISETTEDLFDSQEEANKYVLSPETINKYIGGDLGNNELYLNRARLVNEFEDICNLMFKSVEGSLKEQNLYTQEIKNYLFELKQFILMRKKDFIISTESIKSAMFRYDFEAIQKVKYSVDPNSLPALETPLQFKFYHDKEQKKHISNQFKLYANKASDLGKMIQQSDIRMFFRQFSRSQ